MSVSLADIWFEPLANSPPSPPARLVGGSNHDEDHEDDNVFRPSKRRRSTLFLDGSDDEQKDVPVKSPAKVSHVEPDIDSLFNDLDERPRIKPSQSSKPFDLAALRRDAKARAEREAPSSSAPRYAVESSSPPRDGIDAGGKDASRFADESGANKKREIPKLNEERLLGKDGFPALVQACKNFKPKGKGHELSDLNRLFSLYQFWSHKMYPKLQFSDTVNRIEKLCHSKRMHSALSGWIDDVNGTINGKKFTQDEDINMHSGSDNDSDDERRRKRDEEDVFGPRREIVSSSSPRASSAVTDPPVSRPPSSASNRGGGGTTMMDDDDPFDLDALLQQEEEMKRAEAATAKAPVKTKGGDTRHDFASDEDDEMLWAELQDRVFEDDPTPVLPSTSAAPAVHTGSSTTEASDAPKAPSSASSSWDDDDAWDVLNEMEAEQQHPGKTVNGNVANKDVSSEPLTNPAPTSSTSNGMAAENSASASAPVKSIDSNDDDWDDMYV